MSWEPSQTHVAFACQGLCANSLEMSPAPAAPACVGTPLQAKTIRYMWAVLPFGQWCISSKIKHSPVRPRHSEAVYAVSFGNWSSRMGFIGSAI